MSEVFILVALFYLVGGVAGLLWGVYERVNGNS